MKESIHNIKIIADRIERAADKIQLEGLIDEMIKICKYIKDELKEKKKIANDIKLENINTISFLYKPILKKNYYEGTYLEEFSERRTYELKEAKALDVHNKFWQTHEVLRGNIFGSIPLGLISKDVAERLKFFGWDEVCVDVFEVQERKCSMKELVEYCKIKFLNFLIVNEKSTGAELILHYNI
ncbi:hypothetical protein FQB35_10970 [Crassaminicella thermophila]|uniref:Uncharacterized protein n=1 Tax=Crassaminicella thermophila TaxID=2599308 RepID=A0A5C0SHA9_CRATE|nr:hypothetical protein [Crassaminicella thermophila]QEK12804.1 hypothetical protein FQB35_10970 [Crassaminicella thermophila]